MVVHPDYVAHPDLLTALSLQVTASEDLDLAVIDLSVTLVSAVVLVTLTHQDITPSPNQFGLTSSPDLLDHGGDDHKDERSHGGEGGHGGLGEAELDDRHDQEVEVGHPPELLQGVNQPECEDVVFGALDEVVAETELKV